MILSKKNKFLFIKGRKVASTSVEVFLSSFCGTEDIITPHYFRLSQHRVLDNLDHNRHSSRSCQSTP